MCAKKNKAIHDEPSISFEVFSSRIRKMYIQLHDFSYYHGPCDEDYADKRIIGRKRIIERIKALFENSEISTGAYLITGYRGSGKTSIVNKVIGDISDRDKLLKNKTLAYFLVIFLIIMISGVSLIKSEKLIPMICLAGASFLLLTFIFLFRFFYLNTLSNISWKYGDKMTVKGAITKFFHAIPSIIINEPTQHNSKNLLNSLTWLAFVSYPLLVTSLYMYIMSRTGYFRFLSVCILSLYVELLINIFINARRKHIYSLIKILKKLHSIFILNRYVFIRINLGYSKLSEINILRLLARNLKTELRRFYKSIYMVKFLSNAVILFGLYICLTLIFESHGIKKSHDDFKYNIGMLHLFYSQSRDILDSSQNEISVIYSKINSEIEYNNNQKAKHLNSENSTFRSQNILNHRTNLEYIWEKFDSAAIYTIPFVDATIYEGYHITRRVLVEGLLLGNLIPKNIWHGKHFLHVIPINLDYLFLLYLILFYFLLKWLFTSRLFRMVTPGQILRRIDSLNDIIVSEITTDKPSFTSEKSNFNIFSFFSPKTKKRTVADEREIEKYLIEIIDDIDKIRFPFARPRIVVVLDELDKIEALSQMSGQSKGENHEQTGFIKTPNPSFTIEATRERQQAIQKLLSNLKYFLSDVKAKFIFIAGREMFDASLADISDRNYFMGSIFHEVIYINTFFTDDSDDKPSDITSLIEAYVCSFLIPEQYFISTRKKLLEDNPESEIYEYPTLEILNHYLINGFREFNEHHPLNNLPFKQILARQKREKVIHMMQQFIIYLTHASNGAPKKITNYFENFVCFKSFKKSDPKKLFIVSNESETSLFYRHSPYLVFNFNHQYEIGLINYITVPIIFTISNQIKNYGDKILVSATYLVDHLLKFHRFGFSWRNIETVPEVLEINKTPELRGFVNNVINVLTQTHLQTLISGLYNFRFNRKLSYEISFLSKVSEEASAAFNFTLDVSLAIKHYYFSLLNRLEERYKKITSERTQYIHSIALVHTIIGDLYFYDEEFNDAIHEYLDAIQYLRYSDFSDENVSQLLILVRNMLKLGLSYERRKTYDSAFETFNELCYLLIKYRDIDLTSLGLVERKSPDTETGSELIFKKENTTIDNGIDGINLNINELSVKNEYRNLRKNYENNFLHPRKEGFEELFSERDDFINRLTKHLNPLIEKTLSKISSFEGLRLIYQPLLAKLQIMEKCITGGIRPVDIFRVEMEFAFLQKAIDHQEKYLIKMEFMNRLGDILYFKTGHITWKAKEAAPCAMGCFGPVPIPESHNCKLADIQIYKDGSEPAVFEHMSEAPGANTTAGPSFPENKEQKIPCGACLFYAKSLLLFTKYPNPDSEKGEASQISSRIGRLFNSVVTYYNKAQSESTSLRILAGLISDFADVQLSNLPASHGLPSGITIPEIISLIEKEEDDSVIDLNLGKMGQIQWNSFEGIVLQFLFSALFYNRANENKQTTFQLTKIIKIIDTHTACLTLSEVPDYFKLRQLREQLLNIKKQVVDKAIYSYWSAHENIHITKIYQFKDIFYSHLSGNPAENKHSQSISLRRLSINTDVEEINLAFKSLFMKLRSEDVSFDKEGHEWIMKIPSEIADTLFNIASPYSLNDTMFNRIQRLRLKEEINRLLFFKMIGYMPVRGSKKDFYRECTHKYKSLVKRIFEGAPRQTSGSGPTEVMIRMLRAEQGRELMKTGFCDLFLYLISDSIFCLTEVIRVSNALGKSYLISNMQIAEAHAKLVTWCLFHNAVLGHYKFGESGTSSGYQLYLPIFKSLASELSRRLSRLINDDAIHTISSLYHAEMAMNFYYAAIETHIEGKAYKSQIENMSFLNDDFNDKYSHFNIALERYNINNGTIPGEIAWLKEFCKGNQAYTHDNYFITSLDRETTENRQVNTATEQLFYTSI